MKQVNWDVIRYHATSMVWNFFVDTAYTTKTENDPSAIIACAYWNDVLYVRNVATRRFEIQDLIDFIKNWTEENGYSYESRIYVEPHASGLSVIQSMRYQMPELNVMAFKYPKLNGRTVWDKDKRTKAYAIAPKIEAGQVALLEGNYIDDFAYEVGAFPNSNHDDQVDVLVMACFDSFLRGKKRFISIRK
jgi:predicted phage terminase large subunit-like protein